MQTKKLTTAGFLVALGIVLPQVFHVFGNTGGMIFLPIQYAAFLAGFLLSPGYALMVGVLVPILSSLITGMPPVPKVYFMIPELATYAVMTGILKTRFRSRITLILASLSGRLVYGIALISGGVVLGMKAPFISLSAFGYTLGIGIPGLALQLLIIPVIYQQLQKLLLSEEVGFESK
ncbi:ECF transporter S component [Lachnospiraceae bacterium OttesenSCG-928-J05]|nr:ECF transporter S component [Lachnospiraceae bacterium OttesenSCG-928-J05]